MDMEKEYGTLGEVMYKTWDNRYKQIEKDVKFKNAEPEEVFRSLKIEINQKVNEWLAKREKRKKFGIVTVLLAPVIMLIGSAIVSGTGSNAGLFIALIGILLPVYGFMSMRGFTKALHAAIDFDEKYFDGQVFYCRKNGIAL